MKTNRRTIRSGVQLDPGQFAHALALRGLTKEALAERSGVHFTVVHNASCGKPIRISTLRRLAATLQKIKPLPGAEALLPAPAKAKAANNGGTEDLAASVPSEGAGASGRSS